MPWLPVLHRYLLTAKTLAASAGEGEDGPVMPRPTFHLYSIKGQLPLRVCLVLTFIEAPLRSLDLRLS